jgi:hypothetical protein
MKRARQYIGILAAAAAYYFVHDRRGSSDLVSRVCAGNTIRKDMLRKKQVLSGRYVLHHQRSFAA